MPFYVTSHDFTHGQLDKSLKSRSDLEVYKKGALEIKNMFVKPSGAAKTRFGTNLIAQAVPHTIPAVDNTLPVPDDSTVTQAGQSVAPEDRGYQIFRYTPTDEVSFLVILGQKFTGVGPYLGLSNAFTYYCVRNNKQPPANNLITTPQIGHFYTVKSSTENSFEIDNNQVVRAKYRTAQNQRDMIITTATQPPVIITFNDIATTPATWMKADQLNYRRFPQHDFTKSEYTQSQFSITGAGGLAPGNIPITPPGTAVGSLPILEIAPLVSTDLFKGFNYDGAALDQHYQNGVLQGLGPISDTGTGPTTVSATPGVIGTAIIERIDDNTHARIRVQTPFDASFRGPLTVQGTNIVLTEPAFSQPVGTFPGRGQPRCVSFYESRLILAGSASLPQSLFLSKIGQFQDFDTATGEAADGIAYTIASGAEDAIINMISGRSLEIFTTTSEFSAPVWSEQGLTPSTISIRRQTSIGSSNCIPAVLDNQTLFSKRGGRAIMSFESANTGGNTFNSIDASVYSTELIDDPVHMASYVENSAFDANILLVINRGTGDSKKRQLVVLESLKEQNVAAWTSCETDGEYLNVESVDREIFFTSSRGTSGANINYCLERMNWNVCLDNAIRCRADTAGFQDPIFVEPALTPAGTLPSAYWGKTVYIVGYVNSDPRHPEGVWLGIALVGPTGILSVDIPDRPALPNPPGPISIAEPYEYWIGLNFEQRIETMPIDFATQQGNVLFKEKKIFKVYVQYQESYPFFVNGIEAQLRHLSVPVSPLPPGLQLNVREKPYSGIFMRPTMQKLNISQTYYVGFVREATVLITLDRPLPMTIEGITAGVG